MDDYKPNSYASKENKNDAVSKKKIEKVISGSAHMKKKSEIRRFADVFIADDISNVKSYILWDIIIPAIKDGIEDVVHILLRGDANRDKKRSIASKVSYGGFYKSSEERRDYASANRVKNGFDYDEIVFNNRGDAEAVLTAMDDIIDQFGVVSIGDLYDLAEITTTNYAIYKYGWTDIRSANVIGVRGGYMLKLPRALPLN